MEENLALADALLNLDKAELHARAKLDKPHRALVTPRALAPVAPPDIVPREAHLALLLVLLRVARAATRPRTLAAVAHVRHLRVGRDETHLLLAENVV